MRAQSPNHWTAREFLILILQMRKPRDRVVIQFHKGHTTGRWNSKDLNLRNLAPEDFSMEKSCYLNPRNVLLSTGTLFEPQEKL